MRIGSTSLDTVYKSIVYATVPLTVSSSNYRFSLAGNSQADWLIFSDSYQNTISGWWINENPIVVVATQSYSNTTFPTAKTYIENFPYTITATGGYTIASISSNVSLNVLNSDIKVISNQYITNGNPVMAQTNSTSIPLNPFHWFQGTVFNYSLVNATNNFSLINKISSSGPSYNGFANTSDIVAMRSANSTIALLTITGSLLVYMPNNPS